MPPEYVARFQESDLVFGVIEVGYVGLPLALEAGDHQSWIVKGPRI